VAAIELRTVTVTRYVTPLREGGSLPAIVEADDLGTYVLKFRGAGQGPKALVGEVLAGELARALGLPVPELVFADLDVRLGRSEGDPEIQALISASEGLNLGVDYLPGSFGFDLSVKGAPDADLASRIVWLDAYLSNVDRTARNPNLLVWHRRLWLIDHGAALYFHFGTSDFAARAAAPFPEIRQHVLLRSANRLADADAAMSTQLTPTLIGSIAELLPDAWLGRDDSSHMAGLRAAYAEYLLARLQPPRHFVEEALRAHAQLV
jgi:hypothetical protein